MLKYDNVQENEGMTTNGLYAHYESGSNLVNYET